MLWQDSGGLTGCGKIRVECQVIGSEQDVRKCPCTRGQGLAGYDLGHCLSAFTVLLFYSIYACSSADCISRIRAVYSIYRIYDYSVIDPSGTNITGTSLL